MTAVEIDKVIEIAEHAVSLITIGVPNRKYRVQEFSRNGRYYVLWVATTGHHAKDVNANIDTNRLIEVVEEIINDPAKDMAACAKFPVQEFSNHWRSCTLWVAVSVKIGDDDGGECVDSILDVMPLA